MWWRVSSCVLLHEQEVFLLGKNLALYSPMGAWFVMSLVARGHMEFDRPMIPASSFGVGWGNEAIVVV